MGCANWLLELLFADSVPNQPKPIPPPIDYQTTTIELNDGLLIAFNAERTKNNKSALKLNTMLNEAATKHAIYCGKKDRLSHQGENNSDVGGRIFNTGYRWSSCCENIAMGYATIELVVKGWMNSIGHRANILGDYKEVGFGVVLGRDGKLFWVANLANRRSNT